MIQEPDAVPIQTVATPMSFAPIDNPRRYWAAHFYSVVQCMRYQNNLQYPGRKMDRFGMKDWSFAQLRGNLPNNFFYQIEISMRNFGFQYLIVNLLNDRIAGNIVSELIKEIAVAYDTQFDHALSIKKFYVSGRDSDLSANLEGEFVDIFPSRMLRDNPSKQDVVNFSDIGLVMVNPVYLDVVGVFGEVEGNYGEKLFRDSYWQGANKYCVFGVGVVKNQGSQVYMETRTLGGWPRTIMTFEGNNFIVDDFNNVLGAIRQLMMDGAFVRNFVQESEIKFFIELLKRNWNAPASTVLSKLEQYLEVGDVVETEPGVSPEMTNILLDVDGNPLR